MAEPAGGPEAASLTHRAAAVVPGSPSDRANPHGSPHPAGGPGPEYYRSRRAEVTGRLPDPIGERVLDCGCGAGLVAASLRSRGARHLTGIEIVPEAAAEARTRLDVVICGDALTSLASLPAASFDLLLAYDVLEHLVDPAAVVRGLRRCAAPGALLHVSVPNARSLILLSNLILRGTFGYDERGGLCDATHLRWFTRRDIVALLQANGWRVTRVDFRLGRWGTLANVLSLGLLRDFIVGQYSLCARPVALPVPELAAAPADGRAPR